MKADQPERLMPFINAHSLHSVAKMRQCNAELLRALQLGLHDFAHSYQAVHDIFHTLCEFITYLAMSLVRPRLGREAPCIVLVD